MIKKGTNILLPNGSKIEKGNMNLISIFNPSDDFTREKLQGNILTNSLYFIVQNPNDNDIANIIKYLFKEANLLEEQDDFKDNFLKAQKIAKEGIGEFPITLHEVRKYISFRKSIPDLDKAIFMTFIFNYHFSQKENQYKAQKELKLHEYFFNPVIRYEENKNEKYLIFQSSKSSEKNKLKIKIKNPEIDTAKLINQFNGMTLTEKLCFLFLICCVKAKKTPIIQGVTASGKSFIIKLLADVLGQDLSIYQLNSNSGISLFTGQSIMKDEFDVEEKNKLYKILNLLKEQKDIDKIDSQDFLEFQKKIEEKLKSKKITEEKRKKYEKAKDTLTILKSPLNRFMHQDSELIIGIKTGKWIALDGIELANIQISEKLSSLCGEVPTLNVFESGQEDLNFDSTKINPNFRLFIIYNPNSQNAKKIDQALFNKCIKFTLPSIDSSPRDATTMLYESMFNGIEEKNIKLWSNLCARIARYHIEKTKESKENTDLVAGNVPFTPRNLCFISNDFHNSFINKINIPIESWLQIIFDNYYWRSFIDYP